MPAEVSGQTDPSRKRTYCCLSFRSAIGEYELSVGIVDKFAVLVALVFPYRFLLSNTCRRHLARYSRGTAQPWEGFRERRDAIYMSFV